MCVIRVRSHAPSSSSSSTLRNERIIITFVHTALGEDEAGASTADENISGDTLGDTRNWTGGRLGLFITHAREHVRRYNIRGASRVYLVVFRTPVNDLGGRNRTWSRRVGLTRRKKKPLY